MSCTKILGQLGLNSGSDTGICFLREKKNPSLLVCFLVISFKIESSVCHVPFFVSFIFVEFISVSSWSSFLPTSIHYLLKTFWFNISWNVFCAFHIGTKWMSDIFKPGYMLPSVSLALNLLVGYKSRIFFTNLRIGFGLIC